MSRQIIVFSFVVVCLVVIWQSFRLKAVSGIPDTNTAKKFALEREEMELQMAKIQAKKENLPFEQTVKNVSLVAALMLVSSAIVLGAFAYNSRLHVHILKLRNGVEIPIRSRDLREALPIARDLTIAEKIEATAPEKAFALYERLTDLRIREIQALVGRRGIMPAGAIANTQNEQLALPAAAPSHIPTFAELLDAGEIAPGKPLILGYQQHTGQPERGELSDLYSTIVIGLSGFGKTTFLGFVIASSVVAEGAYFDILDIHYPASESLGATLGKLTETPFVRIISNPFDLPELLSELRSEMSKRLKMPNTKHAPRILVVDEHERWSKNSTGLVKYEIDCVNEGRKVGMFLFITSHSAKGEQIGNTALRDNCVTSYVFKTKPQNAHIFFHDKEKEHLAAQIKQPGQAVFTNRFNDSHLVRIPLASPGDMLTAWSLCSKQALSTEPLSIRETQTPPRRSASTPDHTPEIEDLWKEVEQSEQTCELTPERCKILRETAGISQAGLSERAGVSLSKFKRFELGNAEFGKDELNQIQQVLLMNQNTGAMN